MVNPFDKNFFHFLIGFGLIIFFSFAVLYFTGKYKNVIDGKDVTASVGNIEK